MENTPPPGPGIYEDVSFEEYKSWPYVNNSSLTPAERSMAHFHKEWKRPSRETTDAMRLGSLIHCGKLEPLAIVNRYVVMPDFASRVRRPDGGTYDNPRASAAYKAEVEEFRRQNSEKEIVTQDEYDKLVGVVSALSRDPKACEYLESDGPTEVTLVWDDPLTNLRCKGRVDKVHNGYGLFADLKTTADASNWEREMYNRRYHRQAAFYQDGFYVLTGALPDAAVVVGETSDPFLVRAALVDDEALDVGRDSYQTLLKRVAEGFRTGVWPGYDSPRRWKLPGYVKTPEMGEPLTSGGVPLNV